jgi:hypothetical protein
MSSAAARLSGTAGVDPVSRSAATGGQIGGADAAGGALRGTTG